MFIIDYAILVVLCAEVLNRCSTMAEKRGNDKTGHGPLINARLALTWFDTNWSKRNSRPRTTVLLNVRIVSTQIWHILLFYWTSVNMFTWNIDFCQHFHILKKTKWLCGMWAIPHNFGAQQCHMIFISSNGLIISDL